MLGGGVKFAAASRRYSIGVRRSLGERSYESEER